MTTEQAQQFVDALHKLAHSVVADDLGYQVARARVIDELRSDGEVSEATQTEEMLAITNAINSYFDGAQ
jgi:hypothetical protein